MLFLLRVDFLRIAEKIYSKSELSRVVLNRGFEKVSPTRKNQPASKTKQKFAQNQNKEQLWTMRICRLCLSTDEDSNFQKINAKVTSDCLFVCGITVSTHFSARFRRIYRKIFVDSWTQQLGSCTHLRALSMQSQQRSYTQESCFTSRSVLQETSRGISTELWKSYA